MLDLPPNVRLREVYTDFMAYVLKHTRDHLKADIGSDPWTSDAEIVLAHPNRWGKLEQDFLMTVAVASGLVADNESARSRVYFVEEAEASARYCVCATNCPFAAELKVCKLISLIQFRAVTLLITDQPFRKDLNSRFAMPAAPR